MQRVVEAEIAAPRIAVLSDAVGLTDLASAVAAIAEAGVGSVELTAGPGGHVDASRRDAARVAEAAVAGAGLVTCGLAATGALPLGAPGLHAVVGLARDLGVPFVRVFAPSYLAAGDLDGQVLAARAALVALVAVAGGDVRILLEPAEGTLAPSPELARRVLDGSDEAVGVVYDPANLISEGHLQPSLAVAVLGDLLGHVHVKNRVYERHDGAWAMRYATLADGLVDWPLTVRALDAVGYAGWLSIDHLSDGRVALGRDVEDLWRILAPLDPRADRSSLGQAPTEGRP